jgi:hypothetical protein
MKLGTDGSYNMVKEKASFGWVLIGNKMYWSGEQDQSMEYQWS